MHIFFSCVKKDLCISGVYYYFLEPPQEDFTLPENQHSRVIEQPPADNSNRGVCARALYDYVACECSCLSVCVCVVLHYSLNVYHIGCLYVCSYYVVSL